MVNTPSDSQPSSKAAAEWSIGGNAAFHNFYNDYSHISDPNLRRRLALSEIDRIPFGWYHVRAVIVAGVGFFLDSYDIFAINQVTGLLGLVFWGGDANEGGVRSNGGSLPDPVNQALKASTSGGIIIGMVAFGHLADKLGRRRMYGLELCVILVATLSCALASGSPAISTTGLLIFWRVLMGVGIGGDYPLSSVITSEFAPTRWRGAMMAAVFSMQGLGQLASAIVALITTVAFKDSFIHVSNSDQCDFACWVAADRSWRIIVGVGAVPACLALYYRITIPETPRFTFDVDHDIEKADADIRAYVTSQREGEVDAVQQARLKKLAGPALAVPSASWADMTSYFGKWKNMKMLIGTTMSWLLLDLAFYGIGLNTDIILKAIGFDDESSLYHRQYNQAVGVIILACAGSLPGYWTAVFTVDTFGRKPLQIIGFLLLTILFCIIGFLYHQLSQPALLVLLVLAQFCFNAGPNTTSFLIPGECYPTRYRSTGHGVSAAAGKIGAIIAQGISIPVLRHGAPGDCSGASCTPNLNHLVQIFAIFMLLGVFVSFLVPETKGLTLEEISGEPHTSRVDSSRADGNDPESPRIDSWNPFGGGRPAGFLHPGSTSMTKITGTVSKLTGRKRNSQRIGIMTPPMPAALAAGSDPRKRKTPQLNRKNRGSGGTSHGSEDIALSIRGRMSPTSPRGLEPVTSSEADDYFHRQSLQLPPPAAQESTIQAWTAGWGKVERRQQAGHAARMSR